MARVYVYDLDDTLIQSADIWSSFTVDCQIEEVVAHQCRYFSGQSLIEIKNLLTLDFGAEKASQTVEQFISWYDSKGYLYHKPFPHIDWLLARHVEMWGGPIFVVTNKRQLIAEKICKHLFPDKEFCIRGMDPFNIEITKKHRLLEIRNLLSSEFIYLGDTMVDAKICDDLGVKFLGANWKPVPEKFDAQIMEVREVRLLPCFMSSSA